MKGLSKKILTFVLTLAIIGLYTLGGIGPVFADTSNIGVSKTASWYDKDQGIAKVQLTVNAKSTQIVKQKTTRIVLVLDSSGSMGNALTEGGKSKIEMLKDSANSFVDNVLNIPNADVKVAVVSYDYYATTDSQFSDDKTNLHSAINGIKADGGTNTQDGIKTAEGLMSNVTADNKFIVVLSDGEPTYSYKGTAAVAATTAYNYDSTTWPYRLTSFDYSTRIGSGGSYELGDDSYSPTNGTTYKKVLYDGNNAVGNYYLYNNKYYHIGFDRGNYYAYSYEDNNSFWIELDNTSYVYERQDEITNNGYGTVSEAYNAKAAGNTLYSIGFDTGTTANKVMNSIASAGNYYTAGSDLSSVFSQIAQSIQNIAAGSGAVVTDPMGSSTAVGKEFKFKAITNDAKKYPITVTAPDGMTKYSADYDADSDTFTWNLGDGNLKEGTYTLTYYVKLNLSELKGATGKNLESVLTNNGATLAYTDGSGTKQTVDFTDPSLNVTHYTIEYYYKDSPTGTYTKDDSLTDTAVAIEGCTNIVADKAMENHGNKDGYDLQTKETKYGTGTNENSTALKVLGYSNRSQNVIKLYYEKYLATGSVTFAAKKIFNRTLSGGEFTFNAQKCDADGNVAEGAQTLTGSNILGGAVAITGTTYTQADIGKTEYYLLTEDSSNPRAGVTYSQQKYLAKVQIADGTAHDGNLNVTVTYYKQNSAGAFTDTVDLPTFTNEYKTTAATFNLTAHKTLANKTMTAGEFSFTATEVADADGTALESNNVYTKTASNDADGNINFGSIAYDAEGTHYYKITETQGTASGITYDDTSHIVKVTVTDNNSGALVAEGTAAPTFHNTYAASGQLAMTGTKNMTGRAVTSEDTFNYTVKEGTANVATGTSTGSAITFTPIEYHIGDIGEHTYTITENAFDAHGVKSSAEKVTYKVNVADNGDGTLTVTPQADQNISFTNTYTPTATKVDLKATKSYNKTLQAGDFSFTATEVADAQGKALSGSNVYTKTVTNDADGSVDFGDISYTTGGTHYYKITENAGTKSGVSYDKTSHIVKVTVNDDGQGVLTASADSVPEFTNTYKAASTTFDLTAHKALENKTMTAGEFSFTATEVADADGTAMTENSVYTKTVTNDAKGNVDFGSITYDTEGTHFYKITEVKGNEGGITYDGTSHIVKVTVTDNNSGALVAEGTTAPTFHNSYAASGQLTMTGTKNMTGRAVTSEDTFNYTVKEGDKTVATGTSKGSDITFTPIKYNLTDTGTHTYTITENAFDANGVKSSAETVTYKVDVADKGDGTLTVTPKADQTISFTNTYSASGSLILSGTKSMTGRDITNQDNFAYTITEGGKVVAGGTSKGSDISFTKINYTLANVGTHNYTISEDAFKANGVESTAQTIAYKVVVSDNGDGTLNVSTAGDPEIAFTNTYTPTATKVDLKAKKSYNKKLHSGDFSFTATEVADAQGTALQGSNVYTKTVTNDADGNVDFGDISYTTGGNHFYKITEAAGTKGGVSYDSHSYIVKVTVNDNGEGTLTAAADSVPEFTNTYSTSSVDVNLLASKSYNKTLKGGEFTFTAREIFPVDSVTTKAVKDDTFSKTAENDANGTVDFGKITYTEPGTHTYLITETKGNSTAIAYDDTQQLVTVTVTDNEDGTLSAKADKIPVFTNVYSAKGSLQLSGVKKMSGRSLTDSDKFSFTVKEGTKVVSTGTSTGSTITFNPITYTYSDIGEHTYTITEDKYDQNNVTSSTKSITYKVDVEDNDNGGLTAVADRANEAIEFTNTYTEPYVPPAPPTQVTYLVNYYEKGTTKVLAPQESRTGIVGSTVNYSTLQANELIKPIIDYKYDSIAPESIVLANGSTVQYIDVYYTSTKNPPSDNNNKKNDGGDNNVTPDNNPTTDRSADTGDNWNAGMWMLLALLGAAGLTVPAVSRRKKDR
ncbi:MAG: VWA domain-containing protein [Eubacteriaceae bacterium]|jgi:pilin isopeptide linkage protein|nr:VWA domain-containing protein [Eubacteriaceae bacterium]